MIIDKEYALVDATARLNTDLRDYKHEINNAAIITFGNDLIEVIVYQFSFIISVKTDGEKIKHGLLVNFGKNIARQVSSLCLSAMRMYPNANHKPSYQLFRCIN
ncbi:hypothetical protein OGV67_14410 [Citrobacter sp. CK188]|uniref:hypothetical protein n=1 Tax=Enterobacteriaceae TaxID=543 RepID=UPI001E28980A|nr:MULTISPECIES: hypothetical protein [Enterobacteriaceae]HCJ6301578.1 hypothetical protein [Enterobacter hormaechei subsp. xiangfangensis]MCC4522863.1 hypothetical protein [Enterobacter hormaechei]MCC4544535.1 hypothetical protein [Enterobacter hormaechei]MCC4549701.1 hypothetical protein [Enterobacter hormaechei]MDM3004506.1 hypothetical protein [Citrobacter sp. CK188]